MNKIKEGDLMDCCKPKDDNEMEEHQKKDKDMEGHHGGCCGGSKMWIVMGIAAVVIWYFTRS